MDFILSFLAPSFLLPCAIALGFFAAAALFFPLPAKTSAFLPQSALFASQIFLCACFLAALFLSSEQGRSFSSLFSTPEDARLASSFFLGLFFCLGLGLSSLAFCFGARPKILKPQRICFFALAIALLSLALAFLFDAFFETRLDAHASMVFLIALASIGASFGASILKNCAPSGPERLLVLSDGSFCFFGFLAAWPLSSLFPQTLSLISSFLLFFCARSGAIALLHPLREAATERQARLSASSFLDHALSHVSNGVLLFSATGHCLSANSQALFLLGIEEKDIERLDLFSCPFLPPEAAETFLRENPPGGASFEMPYSFPGAPASGPKFIKSSLSAHLRDGASCVFISIQDLTSQKNAQMAEELARVDALTQLPNAKALEEAFAMQWKIAKRFKSPLSLIFFEIDGFSDIHQTLGKMSSDKTARDVFSALKKTLMRPSDVIARLAGGKGAVLLPHTDFVGAAIVAERLRRAVPKPQAPSAPERTVSAGYSCALPHSLNASPQDLLKAADQALYLSKVKGKNIASGKDLSF